MTNILAICSALNNTYIALKTGNNISSKIIKSDENYHSLYLIKEIKNITTSANLKLQDLNYITTNLGPGSFTGIRVSLTIAKVMAQELNIPLVGLNCAEILLNAYNCDYLIMDARRDMFYLGTKDKIELIYKDSMPKLEGKILCDKRSADTFQTAVCFEEKESDIGKTMLVLAENKYNATSDKNEFNYLNISANYIQTPPIFNR